MPEIKLPEVKLPGLRDMRAEDIKHAISEARPDVKLSDLDPRGFELPKFDLPRVDLAGAASAAAATVAEHNPLRQKRRSRAPMIVAGLIIAGLGTLAALNLGWLRTRLSEAMDRVRTRIDAARVDGSLEPVQLESDSYTGTVGIPIQADTFADTLPSAEPTPIESGLGSSNGSYETAGFDTGSSDTRDEGEVPSR
jgi:hypothetical protein